MASPFDGLIPNSYDIIMADPAWTFKTYSNKGHLKSAQSHYDCMSIEDICDLPVSDLAAEDCLLWLWATNPMLPQALCVMDAWGFQFKSAGTWNKKTKHGKDAFGTGYILRSSNEPYLIGTIGKPKTVNNLRSGFDGMARKHSQKPEEGYARAERMLVKENPRRLDLFSRQSRLGWDAWGNETGKFDEVTS